MKTAPFKLRSGNKPEVAIMMGVSPTKKLLPEVEVKGDKKEVKSKVKIETSKENRDQGLQGFEITYTDGTTKKVLEGKA